MDNESNDNESNVTTCTGCDLCEEISDNERSDSEFFRQLQVLEEETRNIQITANSVKESLMEDTKYAQQLIQECNEKIKETDDLINRLQRQVRSTDNFQMSDLPGECFLPVGDDTVTRDEEITKDSVPEMEKPLD